METQAEWDILPQLSQWPRRTFLLAGLAVELTQLGSVSADYL